jgi:aconitate hydratase
VLENMLRYEDDGKTVTVDDIRAFAEWAHLAAKNPREIAYRPACVDAGFHRSGRILRTKVTASRVCGDAQRINPLPLLVIDTGHDRRLRP